MAGAQTAETLVSLAYNADAIEAAITAEVSVIPILNVIMFAIDILELAGIIPDPISLLIGAFTGRPREQATLEQAGRLMSARNPAARQAGIMLERMVKEWNIVTSETGSGRTILDAWAQSFTGNLTAQGITLQRAREILVNATSEAAQTGLPLEPELQQPLAHDLVFNGPQSMLDTLTQQYQTWIGKGLTIKAALRKAENYLFTKYGLRYLFQLQIGKYIPPNPPPTRVIPSQDGTCPAGYTLDPASQFCVLPSQGVTGGGGGGGGGTQPDPEGDEITNDLCAQMGAYTAAIIQALPGLSNPGGGGVDQACCDEVVGALGNVTTTLASIAAAVANAAGGAGATVDLSGITGALNSLVDAVSKIPGAGPTDFSPIVDALNQIAAKIPTTSGTDVSGIVDKLQKLFDTLDVPMPVYQSLADNGYIDSADLQLLAPGPFGAGLVVLLEKYGEKALLKLSHFLGIDWVGGVPQLTPTANAIMDGIAKILGFILTQERDAVKLITDPILGKINSALEPTGTPNLGNVFVDADQVLADVATVTLNGMLIAMLADALREGSGKPLEKFTELFGGLIGLEELREVQVGPKITYGIAAVAEMAARARYQQSLPGAGAAANWRARGLISEQDATTLFRFNGFNSSTQKWMEDGAYGGLQARMMVRAWESGLFSEGDLRDELVFRGMRPASIQRMLTLAPWLATVSERNQLRAALENAYTNGLFSDADLSQQIADLNNETDGHALIMARVQLQKRLAFAKEGETAYRAQFTVGLLSDLQYRGLLQGIGLQDDWINARVAADSAHVAATAYRKELAAELALERQTAAVERRAAIKNFTQGNINAAALALGLEATNLNPTQAAFWVDLAVLEKAGSLKWTFGLQLPPAEAALLRQRVSALSDQRKRLQITELAFVTALQALGIPARQVQAINAGVNSMISPKSAAVVIPVETK